MVWLAMEDSTGWRVGCGGGESQKRADVSGAIACWYNCVVLMLYLLHFESEAPHASLVSFNHVPTFPICLLGRVFQEAIIPNSFRFRAGTASAIISKYV